MIVLCGDPESYIDVGSFLNVNIFIIAAFRALYVSYASGARSRLEKRLSYRMTS